ncbi:Reverse transcriptase RNA-dependent DNA polymerase [Metschnikowia aff. pulcherrima]|uniref:Reverse transcriptase RNA-dependent DNA polymerase n=1 Tax=Metschnikowia aff. pulcherrima TaxID=2163413 RepID=A0A4P6XTD6_9ASCO|nr:Reverse transcriptase RNA-dependent DNA polymerase [Metschnikowia aff. pulcherrima]
MSEIKLTLDNVAEIESDDEYDTANEDIAELSIERYTTDIQRAFLKGLQDTDNIDLDNSDPVKDINELAAACARDLITNDTAIDSAQSAELNDAKRQILKSLETSVILKAFVAASEFGIFDKYFPSMKRNYLRFHHGNSFITAKVLKKVPCLISAEKITSSASGELGHVLGVILECAKITQPMVRINANSASFEETEVVASKWPSTHEQFATAVVKSMLLIEERQTLPNCFQLGQKLSACKDIHQKVLENAAAFYATKFVEMTSYSIRRIPNYISSYAKRWNNWRSHRLTPQSEEIGENVRLTSEIEMAGKKHVLDEEVEDTIRQNFNLSSGADVTKAISINQEFLPYEIVYVTKVNRTELPTAGFLKNEVHAISEAIPAYTPVLNGRAERANSIVSPMAKAFLANATSDDVIRELLEVLAIKHAVLAHDLVPNTKGHIPRSSLYGRDPPLYRHMPIFGSDVSIQRPGEKDYKERKLQDQAVPGIYVGSRVENSAVHLIWTNFKQPFEEMKIVHACNISFNDEFGHMKEAEATMRQVAESVASQTVLDAPVPAQYCNMTLSEPRPKSSPERRKTRIVKPILVAHLGPTISKAQWDALLQQVAEQEKLVAEVADIREQPKREDVERNTLIADPKYGPLVIQAEIDEINKSRQMKVFEEIDSEKLFKGTLNIGTRYVHAIDDYDKSPDGIVKARCVAHGFGQQIGREETYFPVVLPEIVKAFMMVVAVVIDIKVKQMDVSSAYLHSDLDEPVYVLRPKGVLGVDETKIWKCKKAVYGLETAGRSWKSTVKKKLEDYGFKRTMSDQGLFTKTTDKNTTMHIALYVHDLLVSFEDESDYEDFKAYMNDVAKIKITDLGMVKEFCGTQFEGVDGGYKLHQKDYIEELLERYKHLLKPEKQRIPINSYDRENDLSRLDSGGVHLYQEILGSYNWLAGISRPDLAYCVSKFGSFTEDARDGDLVQLQKVLLYLRDTKDFAIEIHKSHYPDGKIKLYAFSDASFANEEGRKSKTGYIIYLNGMPIGWKWKKQGSVTTSTHASDFVAERHSK